VGKKEDTTLRVVVGTNGGPRSFVWRIWSTGSDVYVAVRNGAQDIKSSLHESGRYRHAFTSESNSPFVPVGDRAFFKWDRPPEFTSGVTMPFRIVVPVSELTTPPREPSDREKAKTTLLEPGPEDSASYITLIVTASGREVEGYPRPEGAASALLGSWALENRDHLWIVGHHQPLSIAQASQLEECRTLIRAGLAQVDPAAVEAAEQPRAVFYAFKEDDGVASLIDVAADPVSPRPEGQQSGNRSHGAVG